MWSKAGGGKQGCGIIKREGKKEKAYVSGGISLGKNSDVSECLQDFSTHLRKTKYRNAVSILSQL